MCLIARSLFIFGAIFLSFIVSNPASAQFQPNRTVPVLHGEIGDFNAAPGEIYRVELVKDGPSSFVARTHVDPTGSFEFRNVPVDSYRVRLLNIQNEAIVERWITLSDGFENLHLDFPKPKGERAGTGTISARALAIKPAKAARKAFGQAEKASVDGNYVKAAELLEQAVRISPDYYQARSNLAVQYLRLNRTAEALEQIHKAIEQGGGDSLIYTNLAYAQLLQDQSEEAAISARLALSMDPSRAATHFILASALLRKPGGNRDEVIRHLQASADAFPQARWLLARLYTQESRLASAAQEARRYLDAGHVEHRAEAQRLLKSLQNSR